MHVLGLIHTFSPTILKVILTIIILVPIRSFIYFCTPYGAGEALTIGREWIGPQIKCEYVWYINPFFWTVDHIIKTMPQLNQELFHTKLILLPYLVFAYITACLLIVLISALSRKKQILFARLKSFKNTSSNASTLGKK